MSSPTPDDLEAIRADYASSLMDLTFNSKPIINVLTMIAEENKSASTVIVDVIVNRLRQAPPKQKLCVAYLVDSIIKNVGGSYIKLFENHVCDLMPQMYFSVDSETKRKLRRLLDTWGPYFREYIISDIKRSFNQADLSHPKKDYTLAPVSQNIYGTNLGSNTGAHNLVAGLLASSLNALPMVASNSIRQEHDYINILYNNSDLKCNQCGLRMRHDMKERMADHYDWHYRHNKRLKEKVKKAHSRDWYLPEDAWITSKDVDTTSKQGPIFFEKVEVPVKPATISETSCIPADTSQDKICPICNEKFSTYYDEEEEDWMIRDAIKIGEKVFHQTCFESAPPGAFSPVQEQYDDLPPSKKARLY